MAFWLARQRQASSVSSLRGGTSQDNDSGAEARCERVATLVFLRRTESGPSARDSLIKLSVQVQVCPIREAREETLPNREVAKGLGSALPFLELPHLPRWDRMARYVLQQPPEGGYLHQVDRADEWKGAAGQRFLRATYMRQRYIAPSTLVQLAMT